MGALVDLNVASSLLACPACHGPLTKATDGYRCMSSSCVLREHAFPTVGRWPVLVDPRSSVVRIAEPESTESKRQETGPKPPSSDRLPRWIRSLWKPRNRVAAANVDQLLSLVADDSPLILVVGGGTVGNGIERLYDDERVRILAFDIYGTDVTHFIADAHQIPLADQSVEAVIVQAVLEHVLDPAKVVAEVRRVLKPRGIVYAETPFLQQVHAGPRDFVRYTSSGHRYLFRDFEEIVAGPVAGPATQLQWSIDHFVRGLTRSALAGKVSRGLLFWLRWLDRLVPESYAMDSASAYFFLGRRSSHRLTQDEILDYYRGAQRSDA